MSTIRKDKELTKLEDAIKVSILAREELTNEEVLRYVLKLVRIIQGKEPRDEH